MGQANQGAGTFSAGQGFTALGQSWHPTILYLLALIVAEMVIFGVIGKILR